MGGGGRTLGPRGERCCRGFLALEGWVGICRSGSLVFGFWDERTEMRGRITRYCPYIANKQKTFLQSCFLFE